MINAILDSVAGFAKNYYFVVNTQGESGVIPPGQDADRNTIRYGKGNPDDPSSTMQHITSQGEYKARNMIGGSNHIRAAQHLIVLLFEYWETEYRAKLATALESTREEMTLSIFGDLRRLKNDIMHRQGRLHPDSIPKLEVLSGFQSDVEITLSNTEICTLVQDIKATLDALSVHETNIDPMHRAQLYYR